MDKEQKHELAREVLENMDLTREQYLELCRLCDDLDLEPKGEEVPEPEEESWDDVINSFGNKS